jgi:hypothetical protein
MPHVQSARAARPPRSGAAITLYELELGIPTIDAIARPAKRLVDLVLAAFPQLGTVPPSRRERLRRKPLDKVSLGGGANHPRR